MAEESLLSPGMSFYEPLERNNPFHRYEGFWIDDVHSSKLGLYRVSASDRYTDPVFASLKDYTGDNSGNGQQFFGSNFTSKPLTIDLAFDNANSDTISFLRRLGNQMGIHTIRFDEFPNVKWTGVLKSPPSFKFVPFDRPRSQKPSGKEWGIEEAILYKGECTLNFEVYDCFGEDNFTYHYVSESNTTQSGEEGTRKFPCRVYRAEADDEHFELVIDGGFKSADENPLMALEEILGSVQTNKKRYRLSIKDGPTSALFLVDFEKDKFDPTKLRLTYSAAGSNNSFSEINAIKNFINGTIIKAINTWGCYPQKDEASQVYITGKRIDVYSVQQAGAGLSVYNPGDIECDYKLWIYDFKFLNDREKWDKPGFYDIGVVNEISDKQQNLDMMSYDYSRARLFHFKNLQLKGNDVGIVIDTKTRLVHGLNLEKKPTANLYNEYLVRENWYKLRYLRSHFSVGRASTTDDGTIQQNSHLKNYEITFNPAYL